MICIFRGDRLRDLRTDKDMSQKELAAVLNVKPNTVSGYETGQWTPSMNIALNIADIFDVSIDYLFDRTNNSESHKLKIPDHIITLPKEKTAEIKHDMLFQLELIKIKHNVK